MRNLLSETISDIQDSGHSIEEIIFIGSEKSGYSCTWEEYERLADQNYDSGFGAPQVASDLIIVFSDGSKMWRHDYDGSEWWVYSTPFDLPMETKPIKKLFVNSVGWEDLEEINNNLEADQAE